MNIPVHGSPQNHRMCTWVLSTESNTLTTVPQHFPTGHTHVPPGQRVSRPEGASRRPSQTGGGCRRPGSSHAAAGARSPGPWG